MLNKAKIEKNTTKFFTKAEELEVMNDALMEEIGVDLIKAPATPMLNQHNAFEGGLIDHILRVTKYAIQLNNELPEKFRVNEVSLIKVCFIHQLGKAKLFIPCTSDWHRENQGKMYEYNNDLPQMTIPERSMYYAMKHGIKLTEYEAQSVFSYEKLDYDRQNKYFANTTGRLLKLAIDMAIIEEKERYKV